MNYNNSQDLSFNIAYAKRTTGEDVRGGGAKPACAATEEWSGKSLFSLVNLQANNSVAGHSHSKFSI